MEISLQQQVEALIFCASAPLSVNDISTCLEEICAPEPPPTQEHLHEIIHKIQKKYDHQDYPFTLYRRAKGYQFLTKPALQESITVLLKQQAKKQLSKSSLETLAIIAYKQPITKNEVENIRGVGSDYAIQKLLEKELLVIKGKADTPGRPILYGTSDRFMEYFGLNSLEDLPQPKDFSDKEAMPQLEEED